ncbi:glutathione S-transferase-like [Diprion similis]|uniref:glutathione S-transferase-like n=1 Tax=Diprion similis TaxID=362088 RepID=UPI001EF8B5FE|nr:glutathione S-transferase-like [Diprion similis]
MPQYKLIYFKTTGVSEFVRYLFSYADQDFEDVRHDITTWSKFKPETPYGVLPILEIDGKTYHQSLAIGRYLAKEFNLTGSNTLEDLEIDSMVDTINDYRILFSQYLWETNEDTRAKQKEQLVQEKIPFYLTRFENRVKANGGYFFGAKLTWADLFFVSLKPYVDFTIGFDTLKNHVALAEHAKKINAIPNIKKWLDTRPTECCIQEFLDAKHKD